MNKIEIRRAEIGDEKILAYIQAESWKSAFGEILSPDELAKYLDVAVIEERYANVLKHGFANGTILAVDGLPHCMAFWSKCRDEIYPGSAELVCIHSLCNNWRRGYGSLVMDRVLTEMKEAGYTEAVLWVFEENERARRFYEKLGFVLTDNRKNTRNAVEVMYHKVL